VKLLFEAEASQPNVGGWDARYALPEGNTGTKRTTFSARRGGLPTCDPPLLHANGKPYKELVKIAHPKIIRRRNHPKQALAPARDGEAPR